MVSYDTPAIATKKTQYLVNKQMGGAMWVRDNTPFPHLWLLVAFYPNDDNDYVTNDLRVQWETSGDHPLNDTRSLIRTVTDELKTCGGLEQSLNVLEYPYSKYANLRKGMPGQ